MSRRDINRAFSDAQFSAKNSSQSPFAKPRQSRKRKQEETAQEADTVNKIITAFKQNDFLRLLDLPKPSVRDLGTSDWQLSKSQITKNYRRLSLSVHPDKNSDERARHAFELLNKAHKMLLDDSKREEIMKSAWEMALAEEEKREATATVDEKIIMNSEKIKQKQKLAKMQTDSFNSEIVRQVKERQSQNSLKKRKVAHSKYAAQEAAQTKAEIQLEDKNEVTPPVTTVDSSTKESQTAHERVKSRLKNVRQLKEEDESEEEEVEWRGAVQNKSKTQRRKPRFMF